MAAPQFKKAQGNSASTTLSSGVASGDTSAPLTADTNFAGEGMVIMSEGENVEEFAYATTKAGGALTIPLANRGLEGGSAQTHASGATVKGVLTKGMWNDMVYGILVEHNDDGSHSAITADSITLAAGATPTEFSTDGTMAGDSDTAVPTEKAVKTYVDGIVSTDGWISYSAVTPTSGTLDDPTFELSFSAVDLSTTIYPGMRLKITQSTVKYFIVTKVAFSTNTTVTVYGGTDYDLVSTGTTAITAVSYSTNKSPAGFPMSPRKWTVETTISSSTSQSSPASGIWYNIGSHSIDIPIGSWDTEYAVSAYVDYSSSVNGLIYVALSTSSSSASDVQLRGSAYHYTVSDIYSMAFYKRKMLDISSKTTYYLIESQQGQSPATALWVDGGSGGCFIRAISAYL